VWVMYGSML